MGIKSTIQQNLILLPGWRTKRKIVVFESDDWGSIRMPDAAVFEQLSKKNSALHDDPMSRFDSLESNDDLLAMFEVLGGVKDSNGKCAVLTANTIVANPDFDKIAAGNYDQYYYERFTKTLERYPHREQVADLIANGITAGLYKPQFHGREHVNVSQWMKALKNGHPELLEAFQYRVFGISLSDKNTKRRNLMSALDFDDYSEAEEKKEIVRDGMNIFEEIFGFRSASFIATTYIWDAAIEKTLQEGGVKYLQGIPYQYVPNPGGDWYKRTFHFTGQKNGNGQFYLVRNAFFEPSLTPGKDVVGQCLKRIELAFTWRKPAIIGTHRLNFIGSIDEKNRTGNLKLFRELLKTITAKWPDVEFMSTDRLGDLILQPDIPLSASSS